MNLRTVTGCPAHPDELAWVHAFNPFGEGPCDPCLLALLHAARGRPNLRIVPPAGYPTSASCPPAKVHERAFLDQSLDAEANMNRALSGLTRDDAEGRVGE